MAPWANYSSQRPATTGQRDDTSSLQEVSAMASNDRDSKRRNGRGERSGESVLFHGNVLTMDPFHPRASSLLVVDDRIEALDAEATSRAQELGARSVDLAGRTIIPGLTDAHHHMAQSAAQAAWVEVSPSKCPTTAEIFETLKAAPRTSWIIAWGMDETLQGGVLTREELSEAVPDRPCVVVHSSYHHCWANDMALEKAGIDRSTPDPEGGRIDRDRTGRPTGILYDSAMTMVFQPAQKAALEDPMFDWASLVREHQKKMLSYGFTYLCDACAPPEFEELYRKLDDDGVLMIPMTVCPTGSEGFFVLPRDRIEGSTTGERIGNLVVGPLKIFVDGATRCAVELDLLKTLRAAAREAVRGIKSRNWATVAMLADTTVPMRIAGRKLRRGELFVDEEAYASFVREASLQGFGIITHALGNRAARAVMRAYDGIPDPVGTPRLEHVTIADAELAKELSTSGYGIATQPGFIHLFPWLAQLPVPSDVSVVPVKSFVDRHGFVAFSTDQPSGEPDPWIGLACAVSRLTPEGKAVCLEEAVDPETAIALFTREAARLAGYDGGTIRPQKPADLVVLNDDPLRPGLLEERLVRPVATFLRGRLAWHDSQDEWATTLERAIGSSQQ